MLLDRRLSPIRRVHAGDLTWQLVVPIRIFSVVFVLEVGEYR